MTFAGGWADKVGNRYESWWTICVLLDVLGGRADSIRPEPIGPDGQGVEFRVRSDGTLRWDQAKSGTSFTSWTPHLLAKVVAKADRHLLNGDSVHLVAAVPMSGVTQRLLVTTHAMASARREPFEPPEKFEDDLASFAGSLGRSPEEAVELLARFTFSHHTHDGLRELAISRIDQAVVNGRPEATMHAIHGWLLSQLGKTLYADDVRKGLESLNLVVRPRLGDPQTAASLSDTVDSFTQRVHHARRGREPLPRASTTEVVDHLVGPAKLVVLHGAPGSGKTSVVEQVLTHPRLSDWRKVVIRLDALPGTVHTADALGEASGLAGSPATLLGDLCGQEPSLLVVDQLDAVSTFSGRMPETYRAVEQVLSIMHAWPTMRVLLAVRSVDLAHDQRLRAITEREDSRQVEVSKLTVEEVERALVAAGIDRTLLAPAAIELIRNPLELGLLVEVRASVQGSSQRLTTARLFLAKEGHCRQKAGSASATAGWMSVLGTLAQRLSDGEQLSLSEIEVADLQPEVSALVSAGLLTADGGRVGFFHERYFDFVFARSFVESSSDLTRYVSSTSQSLFRRSQVRQVLDYLLDRAPYRGFIVAHQMLVSPDVRSHLKQVVAQVLWSATPSTGGWQLLADLAEEKTYIGEQVRWLLSQPLWLDVALRRGDVARLLETDVRTSVAAAVAACIVERPTEVATLLRPLVGRDGSKVWAHDVIERGAVSANLSFAIELLDAGELDLVRERAELDEAVWFVIAEDLEPASQLRWLRALLNRVQVLCEQHGVSDPVEALNVSASTHGRQTLRTLAEHDPAGFLAAVSPFIVSTSAATARSEEEGRLRLCAWRQRRRPVMVDFVRELFEALTVAIDEVHWDPGDVDAVVAQLEPPRTEALTYLLSRVMLAQTDADRAFRWLVGLNDLGLGWQSNPYRIARDIISRHQYTVSEQVLAAFLVLVHAETPATERSPRGWKRRGRAEWELLSAFDPDVLPRRSRLRREELSRKFDLEMTADRSANSELTGSLFSAHSAEKMADRHWISAMRHYPAPRDDVYETRRDMSNRLCQQLRTRVEVDSDRFARLLRALPTDVSPLYAVVLLESLAGRMPAHDWAVLALDMLERVPANISTSLMWAVEKFEAPYPPNLVAVAEMGATHPDPELDDYPSVQVEGAGDIDDAVNFGLNCTRGAAAHALARHLWAAPSDWRHTDSTVQALATDPVPAVRIATCSAVGAISHLDPGRAVELTVAMFTQGLEPLGSSGGFDLIRYAAGRNLASVLPIIDRALSSELDQVAQNAGEIWAHLVHWDRLPLSLPQQYALLTPNARVGVARLWAAHAADDLGKAAQVVEDDDPQVREVVTRSVLSTHEGTAPSEGVIELVSSAPDEVFRGSADEMVRLLGRWPGQLPPAASHVVDRVFRCIVAEGQPFPLALLADLVVRLLREGDDETHLDFLDRLVEQGRSLHRSLDEG
ncbi:hypothetical protein [Aeromicrobium sp. WCS2018Hpa-33]|uniref:nSTAND1 domain-containing NTPase n=1 Tax=Aeromicrobium sp. WCS2018Hpa-33 TaxID=3073629 RepID=UPI002882E53B|nr:hypothetical protein [Aeromicrobium sp. WCS2018Hpa-33]